MYMKMLIIYIKFVHIFIQEIRIYRVAWSHRMLYLYRSFSAKEPYN